VSRSPEGLALSLENGTEEATLIANNAASFLSILDCGLAIWVLKRLCPVLFIRRERGKREHRESYVVGTFRREKVPMVPTAKLLNERDPDLAVMFKLLELEWVDDIAKVTGNHWAWPFGLMRIVSEFCAQSG
jgi:hypothetical protein